MRILLLICSIFLFFSCAEEQLTPKEGSWRAALHIGEGRTLPFLFDYGADNTMKIYNAEEVIEIDDIALTGDSIVIRHPVFEGVLKGTYTADTIKGAFIKPSLDRVVPFTMVYGVDKRFDVEENSGNNVTGNWETVFTPESGSDPYIAKGTFKQQGNKVTGTYRTTTGDYRYLEGVLDGDNMKLSTFDGAHAFLFEAKVTDTTMGGMFYSGNHYKAKLTAKRNAQYQLPSADTLTYLKEGYDKLAFSFKDTSGNLVSLEDGRFQNKVVVVQVMGTWCPNCLDESKYYSNYYNENKADDFEFVSLAFEYAKTEERAIDGIQRLQKALNISYPILLAQVGTSSKDKANEKLPMLNHVLSYPTTIFIDKKGDVRKIHTGFNGPATGEKYHDFVREFESFMDLLRSE